MELVAAGGVAAWLLAAAVEADGPSFALGGDSDVEGQLVCSSSLVVAGASSSVTSSLSSSVGSGTVGVLLVGSGMIGVCFPGEETTGERTTVEATLESSS